MGKTRRSRTLIGIRTEKGHIQNNSFSEKMDLNFDQESDDSLMSQIIHDVGKNGTLKRKGKNFRYFCQKI